MQWADEQIMLLEQLTYLNKDIYEDAGLSEFSFTSVLQLVDMFTEERLCELEKAGKTYGTKTTSAEWAAIIRAIKADKELCQLEVTNKNSELGVICFNHPDEPERAIVAFQGTLNGDEWKDNFYGLYETDTECQKKALEYINSLPYARVTVTGHSKGGNKAQYVTILSDKVDCCVSMDGQGFCAEFLEEYAYEIEQKGDCIKNYYLENDFVNILLFPIPNSEQICIDGGRISDFGKNHSPSAFFQYYKDETGDTRLMIDEENNVLLKLTSQGEMMALAHEFTCFIENVMPEDKQKQVAIYLGLFVALLRGDNTTVIEYNGKIYTKDTALQLLYSDPESLAIIIVYLVKFIDTYHLTEAEIDSLAMSLGLSDLVGTLDSLFNDHPVLASMLEKAGGNVWEFIIKQLNDDDNDFIIRLLLSKLLDKCHIEIDADELWLSIQREYQAIPNFDSSTACDIQQTRGTEIRNFSKKVYEKIIRCIANVGANTYGTVSSWGAYEGEDWYDSLFISRLVKGINRYFERVYDVNVEAKKRVETVFKNVESIDSNSASKIQLCCQSASQIAGEINGIADQLA